MYVCLGRCVLLFSYCFREHQNCIFFSMASDGMDMDMYVQHPSNLDAHALAAYNVVGLVVGGH